jgi:hypothetical protein
MTWTAMLTKEGLGDLERRGERLRKVWTIFTSCTQTIPSFEQSKYSGAVDLVAHAKTQRRSFQKSIHSGYIGAFVPTTSTFLFQDKDGLKEVETSSGCQVELAGAKSIKWLASSESLASACLALKLAL